MYTHSTAILLLRALIQHQHQSSLPAPLNTLAATLGLDKHTAQRALQEWRQSGINLQIQQHNNGEYVRLLPSCPFWNVAFLRKACPNWHFFYKPVIDSTNEFLLKYHSTLAPFSLCLTEFQTAGRGRRGRSWHSPFAGQLTFSFTWYPPMENIAGLSVVIGIATAEALQKLNIENVQLKWPNDILLNGKKLGGILIEHIAHTPPEPACLVIGVGLNITEPTLPDGTFPQPCTGLHFVLPKLSREQVLSTLLKQIQTALIQFTQQGFTAFLPHWNNLDYFHQKPVTLWRESTPIHGTVLGLTDTGALRLQCENGQVQIFHQGEVSLRAKA